VIGFAHLHCRLRNAGHPRRETRLRAQHATHPHVPGSQFNTLCNDLFSHFGVGQHEHCVRFFRQTLYVRIARRTIMSGYARIDRVLMAFILELFIIQFTACFAFIRYSNNIYLLRARGSCTRASILVMAIPILFVKRNQPAFHEEKRAHT
jgi:hypothetical protein